MSTRKNYTQRPSSRQKIRLRQIGTTPLSVYFGLAPPVLSPHVYLLDNLREECGCGFVNERLEVVVRLLIAQVETQLLRHLEHVLEG